MALLRYIGIVSTVDGFHEGKRRSTYLLPNLASVGPEAGRGIGLPTPFSLARKASAAVCAWRLMMGGRGLRLRHHSVLASANGRDVPSTCP